MSLVRIDVSHKQRQKLGKGHKVRVKGAMEGEGVCMIVHPDRYDTMTRTFNRGKGMEMALTPEELQANVEAIPHMGGSGIYDNVKSFLKKHPGLIHMGKPLLKTGIAGALGAAGTALSVAQPELIPLIAPGVAGMIAGAHSYLDRPMRQSNVGGSKAPSASSLLGQVAQNHLYEQMNNHLGTQYGALGAANLGNAVAHKERASMAPVGQLAAAKIGSPEYEHPTPKADPAFGGFGLYGGSGLYAGKKGGMIGREIGSVGRGGSLVSHSVPPALQSQPFSANFQFQHTLPPAYQKFSKGSGLY
jgi:hypothetical protein